MAPRGATLQALPRPYPILNRVRYSGGVATLPRASGMGGSITEGAPPFNHSAENHEKRDPCLGKILYMNNR